jgi:hypothetical protein
MGSDSISTGLDNWTTRTDQKYRVFGFSGLVRGLDDARAAGHHRAGENRTGTWHEGMAAI